MFRALSYLPGLLSKIMWETQALGVVLWKDTSPSARVNPFCITTTHLEFTYMTALSAGN